MTRERPIIMSAESVRAILDGRKTQTRRVVTAGNSVTGAGYRFADLDLAQAYKDGEGSGSEYLHAPVVRGQFAKDGVWERIYPRVAPARCWDQESEDPDYTPPASRLWVREALERGDWGDRKDAVYYRADGTALWDLTQPATWVWKRDALPAMFMPRGASRITLEILSVRVQRLREITEDDAIAEGARRFDEIPDPHPYKRGDRWSMDEAPLSTEYCLGTARFAFANLWNRLHARDGHGWEATPWVWVIDFRRIEP